MKTTPVHVTRSTIGKLIVKPAFSVVAITSMPIASMEGRALKGKQAGSAGLDCHTFLTEPAATPDQAGGKTEAFFEGLFSDRLTSSWSFLAGAKTSADGKFADAP